MSRKVIIYNTIGDNAKEIMTTAGTWGTLQNDMTRNGIHFDGMKAVVGETQNTLESSEAALPEGEFSLFLMAGKVKSGNMDDSDLVDNFDDDSISWEDVDWDDDGESPENYVFKSHKDLMLARAKKTAHYLAKVMEFLLNDTTSRTTTRITTKESSLLNSLRTEAAKLQKNLDVFN